MGKLEKLTKSIYRIQGLYLKELRVLMKDIFAMLIIFALPIFLVLFLGGVFGGVGLGDDDAGRGLASMLGGGLEIPIIGLIDDDNSEGFPNVDLSKVFVNKCRQYEETGEVEIIESNNQTELEILLGKGVISAYIIIPEMFEYNLSIHFPAILFVVIDILELTKLQASQGIIDIIIEDFREENKFTGVFNYEITQANIPETGRQLFSGAPLFFPMVIFAIASLTGAQLIVSDIPKDRMALTPANKFEIIFSKLISLQTAMTLLIIILFIFSYFLGLQIRGSVFDFFWILFLCALLGVIYGLFMSSVAREPLEALQLFIFVFIFQIISVLFVQNELILSLLPLSNANYLIVSISLRGQSPLSEPIYYLIQYSECIILFFAAYLFYRRRKVLL
ncbi:MAG: ABC transporter permease [Candidatus Lokiarchaeota archaeon]|nr:ABC transporter permease [Candidatus Lokiarchaeota archaeon]